MERQLMDAALDKMAFTLTVTFSEEQISRLLVGYLAACELYVRNTGDGDGQLPNGVLQYHNEAKRLLGLPGPRGNGGNS
jgi:hypothetical protein